MSDTEYVRWFDSLGMDDVAEVGGKNASLGEMVSSLTALGVEVPNGFATTSAAFIEFLQLADLTEAIQEKLDHLDVGDVAALTKAGAMIRQWVTEAPLQPALETAICAAYRKLSGGNAASVAVRSSATAEDLPDASFAVSRKPF